MLSKYSFEFSGAMATVAGYIRCWFDIQQQTYEQPYHCDLIDAACCVESVQISFDNEKIKHLTAKELNELDNLVNKFLQ